MGLKLIFAVAFIFLGINLVVAQEKLIPEKKVSEGSESNKVRPDYVLKIKLKKKSKSKKMIITSLKYEKRQTKLSKMLMAQKERILRMKVDGLGSNEGSEEKKVEVVCNKGLLK